ncbi:hypothetical protein [Marinobacter sp.]|uniref:hypothetical protein n=1 Tax=Marinobacter sp. TaxID=50741 RepID=UPI0035C6BE36
MTTVNLAFQANTTTTLPAGWNRVLDAAVTGQKIADLVDSTGASTGLSLWVTTAFTGNLASGGLATADAHGIPEEALEQYWYSSAASKIEIRGFAAGQTGTISALGDGGNGDRNTDYIVNGGSPVRYDANGGEPFTAPVSIAFTANGSGVVEISGAVVSTFWYLNAAIFDYTVSSGPTITNIDTDNAVNQYQQAVVNVSDFTETITSVTLGGVACTVPENDPTDNQITVGVPGSLITGTYDLVISGATETDTLTGVSYTQTHARPAFDGLVDSNSILNGQSYTPDTYFRFVTSFSNGTLDLAAGDAAEWAGDIADYYTPNAGFTGDDTASIEFLYSDGTTSAAVPVTITVPDTLSPAIDSVTVPTAGTYIAGQALQFTVNWNEVVNVTGTPALNLQVGGSPRQANYVSGTGTAALVFSYTVQSGDEDADGIVVSSLTLDGGTIQDAATNPAYLTLNSVGDTSGVLVDGVSPVISINPLTTLDTSPIVSGSAGDATSLTLVVTGVGTYNPVPSGGSWSQQLPTLALGDYPMTLNGQDSAGNPATEASATLSIVEEIVSVDGGLFRPLFRSQGRGLFRNLFR